jgi:hypothetical protein
MKNIIYKYGLISGVLLIVLGLSNWFFIAQSLGYYASEVFGYGSMIIALLAIPVAIRYFREQVNEGAVLFVDGFKIGFGISAITSAFMFLYSTAFFYFQGDQFIEWAEMGMPAEEWVAMQEQMAQMPPYMMSAWFQGLIMFFTVLIIGLIITLVSAMILRTAVRVAD